MQTWKTPENTVIMSQAIKVGKGKSSPSYFRLFHTDITHKKIWLHNLYHEELKNYSRCLRRDVIERFFTIGQRRPADKLLRDKWVETFQEKYPENGENIPKTVKISWKPERVTNEGTKVFDRISDNVGNATLAHWYLWKSLVERFLYLRL